MYTPLFAGSLGAGISQTLNQNAQRQSNISAYLNNVNLNNQTVGNLDLLAQFADGRENGLSPNQSLFNISQNALNPNVATQGFAQFAGLQQAQAPFALGAALQGNTGLLNQLSAPLGVTPQQGTLLPQNILQAGATIGAPGALGGFAQQAQNEQAQAQAEALAVALQNISNLAQQNNQQQNVAQLGNRLTLSGNILNNTGIRGNASNAPSFNFGSSLGNFPSFSTGSSSTGTNGFTPLFGR